MRTFFEYFLSADVKFAKIFVINETKLTMCQLQKVTISILFIQTS